MSPISGGEAAAEPGGFLVSSLSASCRDQLPLAADDFGGEPQIGLAAGAFQIVEQRRLAVGRRLADSRTLRGITVS